MNKQMKKGFLFSSLIISLASFSGLMITDLTNDQIQKTAVVENNYVSEDPAGWMLDIIIDDVKWRKDFATGTEQEKADKFNALPFKERMKYIRGAGVDPSIIKSEILFTQFNYKPYREVNFVPTPWTNGEWGFNYYPSHPGDHNSSTTFPTVDGNVYIADGNPYLLSNAPKNTTLKSKISDLGNLKLNEIPIEFNEIPRIKNLINKEVDNWNKNRPANDADYNKRFPILSQMFKFELKNALPHSVLSVKNINVTGGDVINLQLNIKNFSKWNGEHFQYPNLSAWSFVKLLSNPYIDYDYKNKIDLTNDQNYNFDIFKRDLETEINKFNSIMENNKLGGIELPTFNAHDFPIFKKMKFKIKNLNRNTRIYESVTYNFNEETNSLNFSLKFYSISKLPDYISENPVGTLHSQVNFFKEPEPVVEKKESLSIGAISGISVGSIVFIAACAVGGFFLIKMLKSKKDF